MNSVVVVGAGGFGREVLEIFKAQNQGTAIWNIVGFLDDDPGLHGRMVNGHPVLGGVEWLREHSGPDLKCVCAIGTAETRKAVVERLEAVGARFCNAVHPSVIMTEFVELGQDVIISMGSILTVNIKIGGHVHIDTNCTVAHDVVLGGYSRLAPGVRISGNCRVGEGALLGTGATLVQGISIGSWSTIGAGAVVIEDIPDSVVAVGVPAKVVKSKEGIRDWR